MKTITGTLVAGCLAFASAGAAFADNHAAASGTIVDVAVGSPDHTTLVSAVQAAGLAETLSGEGPFTVFAPVNAAFEALPAGTLDTLLQPESREQLTTILTCHVVEGSVMSDALGQLITDGGGTAEVETLGGCTLTAQAEGGNVTITDENGNAATVTAADLAASNGVVHVIDAVILPAS